jgi:hypothetical protein
MSLARWKEIDYRKPRKKPMKITNERDNNEY